MAKKSSHQKDAFFKKRLKIRNRRQTVAKTKVTTRTAQIVGCLVSILHTKERFPTSKIPQI